MDDILRKIRLESLQTTENTNRGYPPLPAGDEIRVDTTTKPKFEVMIFASGAENLEGLPLSPVEGQILAA
jgi:hypothetical protein